MSERHARTHSNKSNRARDNLERKAVYNSVLDNPFQLRWPLVPDNVQNAVLAGIISALDGVADIHHEARRESRKRKRGANEEGASKKAKPQDGNERQSEPAMQIDGGGSEEVPQATNESATISEAFERPPSSLSYLTFGINEVTKLLEAHAQDHRQSHLLQEPGSSSPNAPSTMLVAVCLADINPPILIRHLPNLVAACNSGKGSESTVWLVPLPKGSEDEIAAAAGLRRVAAIAIKERAPQFANLKPLLDSVPVLTAPWLRPGVKQALIPPHIKQLKTTAPKDMRAAKEVRTKRRAAAKQRKGRTTQRETIAAQQG